MLQSWKTRVSSVVKNPPASVGDARDTGLTPELESSLGEGHGNLLQYSCTGNPMDRGVGWATVHRVSHIRVGHNVYDFTFL